MPTLHPETSTIPRRLTTILLTILATAPAFSEVRHDFSRVDDTARKALADEAIPSVAFAIAKDGEILHLGAFGYADREAERAATVHTAYPLASATKPITATAILVLHEKDRLSLDTTLRAALPALHVEGTGVGEITLTQLLTHTSGLGTYARIRYGEAMANAPDALEDWREHAVTVNTPGRIAEYSNLGYGILGEVLSAQAGLPLATVVEKHVFAPLGMEDAFIDTPRPGQTDVAAHYDAAMIRLPALRNNTPGAGNAYASANDLIRFAMMHAGTSSQQLLSPAGVSAMQARYDSAYHHYYGDAHYGLGWYVRTEGSRRVVWHEGGMPGASAIIKLLPDQRLAVVVLANSTDANTLMQDLANQLIRAVIPDFAGEPLDPVAGYAPLVAQPGFAGSWSGSIKVNGVDVTCSLTITVEGAATFRYQAPGQAEQQANVNAIVKGDSLISALPGRLPSRDTKATSNPFLLLKLVRTGDTISGAVVAYASPAGLEYLLPFPIKLQRQSAIGNSSPVGSPRLGK